MRGVLACAVVGVLAVPARAEPPPLIAQAVKDAAEVGHPLVVELHASWCRPCKWFEAHVLPRTEVQAALETVDFIRYDVDSPEGEAVVKKYRTTAVPTFLVLDPYGVAVERVLGLQGRGVRAAGAEEQVAAWFVELLTEAKQHTDELSTIQAAIEADPRDTGPRLALARYYRESELGDKAIEAYRAITDATPAFVGDDAATAASELDDLLGADKRVNQAVNAALAFATKHPSSRLATRRLALAAVSGRVSEDEIRVLLRAHLAQLVPGAPLAEGIRLALGLRMRELVDAAMATWKTQFPDAALRRLVEVEILILDGKYAEAAKLHRELCTSPPRGIELQCYVLRTALRETWRGAPGARRLLSNAATVVRGLEHPGEGDHGDSLEIDELEPLDVDLGNALAHSLRVAEDRCADRAERPGRVTVSVRLDDAAGVPRAVDVVAMAPVGVRVQRCIEQVVAAAALPEAAIEAGDVLYGGIELAPDGAAMRAPVAAPNGMAVSAIARGGDLASIGVGASGLHALGRVADFSAEVAWETELGIDEDEAMVGAVRGMVGLAIGSERWQFAALVGLGASRVGAIAPTAAEVPFELRLDGALGANHLHLWARGAWLYGAAERARTSETPLFSADETAIGVAFGSRRIYVGAQLEDRELGRSAVFLFGVPIGRLY
jgi:thiol-disulfide isomerase/thioredoxin